MTLTLLRSSAELVDPALMQDSVKSVFSSFNWSNRPVALQPVRSDELQSSTPLNLTMSVQQFFGRFAWEAESIAPPIAPEQPPSDRGFTLDDFSDLF